MQDVEIGRLHDPHQMYHVGFLFAEKQSLVPFMLLL